MQGAHHADDSADASRRWVVGGGADAVASMRAAVAAVVADVVDAATLEDITLALSELLTNAMEHGDDSEPPTVELRVDRTGVELQVVNSVGRARPPPMEDWRFPPANALRGRGLGIVRAVADGIEMEAGDDRVLIVATWRLPDWWIRESGTTRLDP